MPVDIIVCVKQVVDPDVPVSALCIDRDARWLNTDSRDDAVLNGFDENAVEAALQIKESLGGTVTILSLGSQFSLEVMKKPLSMGADRLVLVEDAIAKELDSYGTAYVLSQAIRKIGRYDLVLTGRQSSDWDNSQVPIGIAEMLGLPAITLAQKIQLVSNIVEVNRTLVTGYELVEADLPALVTVSNELGEPRYPTLRGIMSAGRMVPVLWTTDDLILDPARLQPKVLVLELFVPTKKEKCEFVEGQDEADAGRRLALRLREESII